jgi:hypothetical protein
MATIDLVTMYDTIGSNYANIPAGVAKVAGYVTGSPDIVWPAAAWKRFPRSGLVRVDQSPDGDAYGAVTAGAKPQSGADVYDMEQYAGTPGRFAQLCAVRHARGLPNCGYGSHITLAAAAAALDALGGMPKGWWHGSVDCWLAAPSMTLAEASNTVGSVLFGGLPCVGVQWATPASNPDTKAGTGTLKTLNLDLSIARADWFPAAPNPEAWQVQALGKARAIAADATALANLLQANL